jgi:crossover junction endodeoxyribonuclease RusA
MNDYSFDGISFLPSANTNPPVNEIHFIIPGEPLSKERPRMSKTGHAYTPDRTRKAEKMIREVFERETAGIMLQGPVELTITLFLGSKRRKDLDNMAKLIQDSLNGLAFEDDSQVHALTVSKCYTKPLHARAEVSLRETTIIEEIHHVEENK